MSSEVRLQSLLETALATGNLIAFRGRNCPCRPTRRGTWSVAVYGTDGVMLYSFN
jgi:hypothetical protein